MDIALKEKFISLWKKYFNNTELPIAFYYSENTGNVPKAKTLKGWSCIICELAAIRKGEQFYCDAGVIGCAGAKRYLGYSDRLRPEFEYFLSCGIPGKMKGERYKISPEVVREMMKLQKQLPAKGKNLIFKRWDMLDESDYPDAVIFFAEGEALSGLFTLANFDRIDHFGVIAPFAAGCGSAIHYPYFENLSGDPKAVLGMFDPSARSCVPANMLSFAVPMKKFEKMIGYMEESFLITETWQKVQKRIS
ncbi:MAG: DUF169 domain-containing protein [Bacteroidota bacterium]